MILNIQFYEQDKVQAMALARLIADLEPVPRSDIHVLFTARFDCPHDTDTIAYVNRKFPVKAYTTTRRATGWPDGPNQMMGESYQHCVELARRKNAQLPGVVMLVEADCVPLHKDWINMLLVEWNACGKQVLGAWLKAGDASVEHVNGNCLISLDFWKRCPEIIHPLSRGGWDATLRHRILPHAAPSKLIWSDYQLGQDHNPWRGDDFLWAPKHYGAPDNPHFGVDLYPCWFHGIKTMDGIKAVRKRLLDES